MDKLNKNSEFNYDFSFSQEDVNVFAEVTGDKNPLHLDTEFAEKSIFKRRIIHGFLAGSIFSKILSSFFPGEGTIYLSQSMNFLKPMYADEEYTAHCKVLEILPKNRALLITEVLDSNGVKSLQGEAVIMNLEMIPRI